MRDPVTTIVSWLGDPDGPAVDVWAQPTAAAATAASSVLGTDLRR
jgi:hypothetical protein